MREDVNKSLIQNLEVIINDLKGPWNCQQYLFHKTPHSRDGVKIDSIDYNISIKLTPRNPYFQLEKRGGY